MSAASDVERWAVVWRQAPGGKKGAGARLAVFEEARKRKQLIECYAGLMRAVFETDHSDEGGTT